MINIQGRVVNVLYCENAQAYRAYAENTLVVFESKYLGAVTRWALQAGAKRVIFGA